MKPLTQLLSTVHGRDRIALGIRGAVSPNPKAASQDRKCVSSAGPCHLFSPQRSAEMSFPLLACVRVLCEGWRVERRLRMLSEYVILRGAETAFNRDDKDPLYPLSSGKISLAHMSFC